jgi:hypothetical protein
LADHDPKLKVTLTVTDWQPKFDWRKYVEPTYWTIAQLHG